MKRQLDLDTLVLAYGNHEPDHTFCVMEAVAYVAGETWSDHPQCASPVIAAFLRAWNDTTEPYGQSIRDRLRPYITRLVDSKGSPAIEKRRSWLALDWLIRVQGPAWMRLTPALTEHANALANLPTQIDAAQLKASKSIRDAAGAAAGAAARDAARAAAWAAARDAAWDAAGDAARAAAWDAAWAAARDAGWDAAGAAARAAAWDAAGAAAGAALAPSVAELQTSAFDLLDRMLAVEAE